MSCVYVRYAPEETIPVAQYLKSRKLKKYFNRETAAAITAMGQLLQENPFETRDIPIYYATGKLEFEDYGLRTIVDRSTIDGQFSSEAFITKGLAEVSPLSQFKILQNMPLCFASIEFGFQGDNAVVYSAAGSLLYQAKVSPADTFVLGAGKTWEDGTTEVAFALLDRERVALYTLADPDCEAIELFHTGGLCD